MAWAFNVNIKRHLTDDVSAGGIKNAYLAITKELEKVPLPLPAAWHRYSKMAIADGDVEIFNRLALVALYDWADENRVWMGLR